MTNKIAFKNKLTQHNIWAMLATFEFGIFCLPVIYLKMQRLKYIMLQFCLATVWL